MENRIEREILRNYANALRAVRKEMESLYDKFAVDGVLSHADMTRFNRDVAMNKRLTAILKPYGDSNTEMIRMLTESQYEAAFYRTGWSYDNALRVDLGWGQIPVRQVKAAVWNKLNLGSLKSLSTDARRRLMDEITQGLIRGSSMPRMMRGVRDALGVSARQAMTIVRTEAHRAREIGHLGASQDSESKGVELLRAWDASLDSKVRPLHARLDGKKVKPGEKFLGLTKYPGGFGIAKQDINCRCTVTDVIEGYEPEDRRASEDIKPEPYRTFEKWAKDNGITKSRYGQLYQF